MRFDKLGLILSPGENPLPKGQRKRIEANIRAIELVRAAKASRQALTEDELKEVAQFSGWGAHKEVLNTFRLTAFDEMVAKAREWVNNPEVPYDGLSTALMAKLPNTPYWQRSELESFANRFKEELNWYRSYGHLTRRFKAVLSAEEMRGAQFASSNSHFTDPDVAREMWTGLKKMGFTGGRVMECSIGTGLIIATMPEDLREKCEVVGVELDPVTAEVAKALFPGASITVGSFLEYYPQEGERPDVIISNVPFQRQAPKLEGAPMQFNLHNSFFYHGLRVMRPGGMMFALTSASTLENNPLQRRALSEVGEFMGGVRLPNTAFLEAANTEVVTDMLAFRRPDGRNVSASPFLGKVVVAETIPDPDKKPAKKQGAALLSGGRDSVLPSIPQGVPLPTPFGSGPSRVRDEDADDEGEELNDSNGSSETGIMVNEYFAKNPGLVLGRHSLEGKMYGRDKGNSYTVMPDSERPLKFRIAEAFETAFPQVCIWESNEAASRRVATEAQRLAERFAGERDGRYVLTEQGVRQVIIVKSPSGSTPVLREPWWKVVESIEDKKERAAKRKEMGGTLPRGIGLDELEDLATDLIQVRDAVRAVYAADLSNTSEIESGEAVELRGQLREQVQRVRAKWGKPLSDLKASSVLLGDPEGSAVPALEVVRDDGDGINRTITDAPILTRRTLHPPKEPDKVSTMEEAVRACLLVDTRVTTSRLRSLLDGLENITDEQLRHQVAKTGIAFPDPELNGELVSSVTYLSGQVRSKLKAAEDAAALDPLYQASVAALRRVQPDPLPENAIRFNLGAPWMPPSVFEDFAQDVFRVRPTLAYRESTAVASKWEFAGNEPTHVDGNASSAWIVNGDKGSDILPPWHLFLNAINGNMDKLTYKSENAAGNEITLVDVKGTEMAQTRIKEMRKRWDGWLAQNPDTREKLAGIFNDKMNCVVAPNYDNTGSGIMLPGLSDALKPRGNQKDALVRILQEQAGLLGHDVGYGKTLSMILGAFESKRRGLCRKPMIVCDNASYEQFVATTRTCYPTARIINVEEGEFGPSKRAETLFRIQNADCDIVLMKQSQFDRLPIRPETEEQFLREQIAEVEMELAKQSGQSSGKRKGGQARRQFQALESFVRRAEDRIKALADVQREKVYFEDLGVDLLFVDEAHKYKRATIVTNFQVKGVPSGYSKRGDMMLMKARWLQARRGHGRGVIFATATPCSNTMGEYWNMIRMCHPRLSEERKVESFDTFVRTFCETVTAVEKQEASGKWVMETRLAKFVNGGPFVAYIRSAMDIRNDPEAIGLVRPDVAGGQAILVTTPFTQASFMAASRLQSVWDAYEHLDPDEKKELGYIPLVLIGATMTAAVSPRLIDPTLADDPGSVIDVAAGNIAAIYHATSHDRAAQVVFLDRRNDMAVDSLEQLSEVRCEDGPAPVDDEGDGLDEDEGEGSKNPKAKKPELVSARPSYDAYKDLVTRLVAQGVKPEEIGILQEVPKNRVARLAFFAKVNSGAVRVVIASTSTGGTGVNIQERLIAEHEIDPPRDMTPASMTQRRGRIQRTGNRYGEVFILAYGQVDSTTPAIIQRIARKDTFVRQGLAGKGFGAVFEDTADMSLQEAQASLIGDKRVMRRAELMQSAKDMRSEREASIAEGAALDRTLRSARYYLQQKREELKVWVDLMENINIANFKPYDFEGGFAIPESKVTRWESRETPGKFLTNPDGSFVETATLEGADEHETKALAKQWKIRHVYTAHRPNNDVSMTLHNIGMLSEQEVKFPVGDELDAETLKTALNGTLRMLATGSGKDKERTKCATFRANGFTFRIERDPVDWGSQKEGVSLYASLLDPVTHEPMRVKGLHLTNVSTAAALLSKVTEAYHLLNNLTVFVERSKGEVFEMEEAVKRHRTACETWTPKEIEGIDAVESELALLEADLRINQPVLKPMPLERQRELLDECGKQREAVCRRLVTVVEHAQRRDADKAVPYLLPTAWKYRGAGDAEVFPRPEKRKIVEAEIIPEKKPDDAPSLAEPEPAPVLPENVVLDTSKNGMFVDEKLGLAADWDARYGSASLRLPDGRVLFSDFDTSSGRRWTPASLIKMFVPSSVTLGQDVIELSRPYKAGMGWSHGFASMANFMLLKHACEKGGAAYLDLLKRAGEQVDPLSGPDAALYVRAVHIEGIEYPAQITKEYWEALAEDFGDINYHTLAAEILSVIERNYPAPTQTQSVSAVTPAAADWQRENYLRFLASFVASVDDDEMGEDIAATVAVAMPLAAAPAAKKTAVRSPRF